MGKFLGISVTPSAVQSEGLHAVLDRIQATGAMAISTGTGLVRPVPRGQGQRMPPLDIDGHERLLDRPLWGQRELWGQGFGTIEMDRSLFGDTTYLPKPAAFPTDMDRALPHKIISEAHARGLQAHLQIGPTSVPGLLPHDSWQYVDGSQPDRSRRVANQGCLNSPAVREYILGMVRNVVRAFPSSDGLFVDWLEYTVYDLRDHFACTCGHCAAAAAAAGLEWPAIVRDVRALWDWLHRLDARGLEQMQRIATNPSAVIELLQTYPGWLAFMRFKADTVADLYREIRATMDAMGGARMELGANGWAPPFNRSSGLDYRTLAEICSSVRPKLYTFHWSVMPRWYAQTLQKWNPGLPERLLLDTMVLILGLPDANAPRSYAQYHIPAPTENHPCLPEAWRAKLDEVVDQVAGRTPCYAYAHSYRSVEQWKRMVAVVRDSRADGMWVTRYGYLSDTKLDILGDMWV